MTEVEQGYQIIENILARPDFSNLLSRLVPHVVEYSRKRIGTHANPDCATEYTEQHLENLLWALGLICQEWILENLRRKTVDGHCHTHKQQTGKPCPKGSAFHNQLYKLCKRSFEEVLEAHRSE